MNDKQKKDIVEEVDGVKRRIEIKVSSETVDKARKSAFIKIKRDLVLPGFRKGKVPDAMILKHKEGEFIEETIKAVVQETYPSAVVEAGVVPLGAPSIEPDGKPEGGKEFVYKALFEVYPKVEPKGYEGLSLERNPVTVSEDDVESELKNLQKRMTQLEPAPEGVVDNGMMAIADFKGVADGKPFSGSDVKDYVVDLDSGELLKVFEDQIRGMKAGEERNISFDYPKDYFRDDLSGKHGEFNIKIKEIRHKIVPALDDEFAKTLGAYKTLNDVRAEIRKGMINYREMQEKNALIEQIMQKLLEINGEFDVPTALIDGELDGIFKRIKEQADAEGKPFDASKINPNDFVTAHYDEALKRARGFMMLRAIADKEGIEVEGKELDERLSMLASQSKKSLNAFKSEMEKSGTIDGIRIQILFEKTFDFLLEKAKIKEVKPKKSKKTKNKAKK